MLRRSAPSQLDVPDDLDEFLENGVKARNRIVLRLS